MTKASVDTWLGLIGVILFGFSSKASFTSGHWIWGTIYLIMGITSLVMFFKGYSNLPTK